MDELHERAMDTTGLHEAAVEVARWMQAELYAQGTEPLDKGVAFVLWMERLAYVNALYWLEGDKFWKAVEREVAPDGRPRSICIGHWSYTMGELVERELIVHGRKVQLPFILRGEGGVEVPIIGGGGKRTDVMFGYWGCLRTFVTKRHGPWATWCPDCRPRKTNARNKAIRDFQRRTAEVRH